MRDSLKQMSVAGLRELLGYLDEYRAKVAEELQKRLDEENRRVLG